MKHGCLLSWTLGALSLAGAATAQPAPAAPAPAAVPVAPAAPVAAPAAARNPATAATPGAQPPAFELREAPSADLVSGADALRPEPGGLTAAEVAARATAESPEVAVAQAKVRAAAAKVDKTVVMFLPRVKLGATYRRLSPVDNSLGGAIVGAANAGPVLVGPCPIPDLAGQQCALDATGTPVGAQEFAFETYPNQYLLNASVAVPISDYVLRLSNALDATKIYERSARVGERAARVAAAANARVAYYDWLRAKAAVAVAESSLTRTQALLADTKTAFTLGAATRADVLRLEALVASIEQMGTEARGFQAVAAERLATIMNEPSRPYRVGEDVLASVPPRPPGTTDALVAEALRQRLEVQALRAAADSIERGVKAARVSQYPRLDAFGDYTYARPNPTIFPQRDEWNPNWALGLSLTYTLNDPLDSRASIAEFNAQKAELEANLRALERGVRLEVTAAVVAADNARSAVESAQRGAAAAAEAYRVGRELYRAGRATTTDLIGAESELVSASLRQVNTVLDVRVADVKLEHALGRDVAGGG